MKTYCVCKQVYDPSKFMIQCHQCLNWFHGDCLDPVITQLSAQDIEQFYCSTCPIETVYIRKSKRKRNVISYFNDTATDEYRWTKILQNKQFKQNNFPVLKGQFVTMEFARRTGLKSPILIPEQDGLGMQIPNFTVSQVAEICGGDTIVECLHVATQSSVKMTLAEWADYFNSPNKSRILNVITLEVGSIMGNLITRPKLVRDLDWVDHVWPVNHLETEYPRVQVYCLMGVKDCYTDFHIDFGGTSVFYHVISGEKIFYFVEPTKKNLDIYESWSSSPNQSSVFFADLLPPDTCVKAHLVAGNTMIIPSGWIHAVYTPVDTVVIGGNFLHGIDIGKQIEIYHMEERTNVPLRFRYPFFDKIQWYAAIQYLKLLRESHSTLSSFELDGLLKLVNFLKRRARDMVDIVNLSKKERQHLKRTIPNGVYNVNLLVSSLESHVLACKNDSMVEDGWDSDLSELEFFDTEDEASEIEQGSDDEFEKVKKQKKPKKEIPSTIPVQEEIKKPVQIQHQSPPKTLIKVVIKTQSSINTSVNTIANAAYKDPIKPKKKATVFDRLKKSLKKR